MFKFAHGSTNPTTLYSFIFISVLLSSCVSMNAPSKVLPANISNEGTSLQKTITLSGETWQYQNVVSVYSMKDFDTMEETKRKAREELTMPAEWKVKYGVITDQAEVKVGELSPGVFLPDPRFYDTLPKVGMILPNPDTETKVLSKDWLLIGERRVLSLSETGVVYGGTTKPEQIILDHYYVTLGDVAYGFVIYNHLFMRFDEGLIQRLIESIVVSDITD